METGNVRKHLKTSQNILNILWCLENANINIQWKLHVSTVIFFRVKYTKFPFFLNCFFVFPALLNTTGNFKFQPQPMHLLDWRSC